MRELKTNDEVWNVPVGALIKSICGYDNQIISRIKISDTAFIITGDGRRVYRWEPGEFCVDGDNGWRVYLVPSYKSVLKSLL